MRAGVCLRVTGNVGVPVLGSGWVTSLGLSGLWTVSHRRESFELVSVLSLDGSCSVEKLTQADGILGERLDNESVI